VDLKLANYKRYPNILGGVLSKHIQFFYKGLVFLAALIQQPLYITHKIFLDFLSCFHAKHIRNDGMRNPRINVQLCRYTVGN